MVVAAAVIDAVEAREETLVVVVVVLVAAARLVVETLVVHVLPTVVDLAQPLVVAVRDLDRVRVAVAVTTEGAAGNRNDSRYPMPARRWKYSVNYKLLKLYTVERVSLFTFVFFPVS